MARKHHIENPTRALGRAIAGDLASEYGLELATYEEADGPDSDGIVWPSAGSPRPASDLVLTASTRFWKMAAAPGQWARYVVYYGAAVELTDSRSGRVLARGSCVGTAPKVLRAAQAGSTGEADKLVGDAPTYDDMLADNARVLKVQIRRAAVRCEASLREKLFLHAEPLPSSGASDGGAAASEGGAAASEGGAVASDGGVEPSPRAGPRVKQEIDDE